MSTSLIREIIQKKIKKKLFTGATEFIRIPLGAHSNASVFVKFCTPARAAPLCLKHKKKISIGIMIQEKVNSFEFIHTIGFKI